MRRAALAPAVVVTALLFLAPMAVIVSYSFLSRGAYGGVELPWTLENYTRFWDPLYGSILVRTFAMAAVSTALCLVLGFPLALFTVCVLQNTNETAQSS